MMQDHAKGCEGRNYTCSCGYDDEIAALRAAISKPVAEAVKVKAEPVGYVTKNELTKLSLGASCVDLFGKVVPKGFEMVPLYAYALSSGPIVTDAMVSAAKSAYWHEVHNGGGYSDKCYEAAIRAALAAALEATP